MATHRLPGLAEARNEPSDTGAFERQWLRTLAHVLVEEVLELYQVEKMLGENLDAVARAATEPLWRYLAQMHTRRTAGQLHRLDLVIELLGQSPENRDCPEMERILIGLHETIAENTPGRPRDLALLAATLKIKQRTIPGYCHARDYAQLLGVSPVAAILQENLNEEIALQKRLTELQNLLNHPTA